jgi:hypothetical protein
VGDEERPSSKSLGDAACPSEDSVSVGGREPEPVGLGFWLLPLLDPLDGDGSAVLICSLPSTSTDMPSSEEASTPRSMSTSLLERRERLSGEGGTAKVSSGHGEGHPGTPHACPLNYSQLYLPSDGASASAEGKEGRGAEGGLGPGPRECDCVRFAICRSAGARGGEGAERAKEPPLEGEMGLSGLGLGLGLGREAGGDM